MGRERSPVFRLNSRAGCLKCKERRIKCDGAQPECHRCTTRNYTCPGYLPTYRWKQKHQFSQPDFSTRLDTIPKYITSRPNVTSQRKSISNPAQLLGTTNETDQRHAEDQPSDLDSHSSSPEPELLHSSDIYSTSPKAPIADANTPHNVTVNVMEEYMDQVLVHPSQLLSHIPDRQTALVWNYFNSVCVINSCYDSTLDPLRTITRRLMPSSPLIYFCVLSMSAAHLGQIESRWALEGVKYSVAAVSALRQQLGEIVAGNSDSNSSFAHQVTEQTLLGVIMLGMSTSWHNYSGLGLEHIKGSRILLQHLVHREMSKLGVTDWPKLSFYLGLQAYWETVASFLLDQDLEYLDRLHVMCSKIPENGLNVHPWTGASPVPWVLLAKVGCLTRKKRALSNLKEENEQGSPNKEDDTTSMQSLIENAHILESQLLSYVVPEFTPTETTQDDHTPISHLTSISRCCKLTGLLELYRAFGSICQVEATIQNLADTERTLYGDLFSKQPFAVKDIYRVLALGILETLHLIPKSSNTRCLHPIFLLIVGNILSTQLFGCSSTETERGTSSQLTIYESSTVNSNIVIREETLLSEDDLYSAFRDVDDLQYWRCFVLDRLMHLESTFHLQVLSKVKLILQNVWASNDNLGASSHSHDIFPKGMVDWVDVMETQKLEYLF